MASCACTDSLSEPSGIGASLRTAPHFIPAVRYIARYTYRVAIANRGLVAIDDEGVSFKWKDYRVEGPARIKVMTLSADEFIRRFLIHVLPTGFHRIRNYGLSANHRRERRPSPTTAQRASSQTAARCDRQRRPRPRKGASLAVLLLRRPHDRHRDLRTRHLASTSSHADSAPHDLHRRIPTSKAVRHFHPHFAGDGHPRPMITVSSHFPYSIAQIATQSRPPDSPSSPSPITRLDPRPPRHRYLPPASPSNSHGLGRRGPDPASPPAV
jgi:Putative transposase